MIKIRQALLLISSLLLASSCLAATRTYLSREESAWLRENGPNIQVLFGYEAPPDAFTNSLGRYDGLLVDYLRELESVLHMPIPMKIFPSWIDIMNYAREDNDNYIIIGIVETEERDEFLLFTDTFYKHRFNIITPPGSTVNSLEDLRGRKFAVVDGYVITELLGRDYPELKPLPVENDLTGLRAVADGEVDAFVTFELYGIYVAETQGITDLRMIPLNIYNVEYRIAVSQDDPILRSIMEKTLMQIGNRKKREMDLRWNSLTTTRISTRQKGILLTVLGALVLITGIVFFWLFLLRKEVERQTRIIRESEKKFRRLAMNRSALILSIPDAMAITDSQARIIETNGILSRMLGQPEKEMNSKRVIDILPFKSPADYLNLKNLSEMMHAGDNPILSFNASITTARGEDIILSISGAPVMGESESQRGEIWILKDITGQRIIENEVLESRKQETIAVLAGGIAHDFNNLLTCLYGYVDISLLSLDDSETIRENLNRALESLENARNLTSQMLSFSRGAAAKKEIIDPSRFLPETAEFSLHGKKISLITDFEKKLPSLYADKGQLSQVISNLVINAGQAMKGQGEIRISAKREQRGDQAFLRISVRDSGPGVPDDIRDEIFKPYFTTKQEGNGLGLASCRTIIENHNGSMELVSGPGEGAEFVISLPVYEERTKELPTIVPEGFKIESHREASALIMEQNDDIRKIMTLFLREMGFSVHTSLSAREALGMYAGSVREKQPFTLFIVDTSLDDEPCSLAREIRKLDKNALTIATCGSRGRQDSLPPEECAYSEIILKPFSFAEFSETINRLLKENREGRKPT